MIIPSRGARELGPRGAIRRWLLSRALVRMGTTEGRPFLLRITMKKCFRAERRDPVGMASVPPMAVSWVAVTTNTLGCSRQLVPGRPVRMWTAFARGPNVWLTVIIAVRLGHPALLPSATLSPSFARMFLPLPPFVRRTYLRRAMVKPMCTGPMEEMMVRGLSLGSIRLLTPASETLVTLLKGVHSIAQERPPLVRVRVVVVRRIRVLVVRVERCALLHPRPETVPLVVRGSQTLVLQPNRRSRVRVRVRAVPVPDIRLSNAELLTWKRILFPPITVLPVQPRARRQFATRGMTEVPLMLLRRFI